MPLFQQFARSLSGALGRDSKIINTLRPAYESALGIATGNRGIAWNINGVPFHIDARCRIQMAENYDASVADFFRTHIKPGAVCYDVGANVGVYVLQFSHWAGPTGRVVAFEPNPAAREVLNRHIAMNGIASQVEIIPAAVSAQPGEAILFTEGYNGMGKLGAPNPALAAVAKQFSVPVVTLDQFTEGRTDKPDWLLIDVEGFEIAVLRGALDLLSRRDPTCGIVVEMHPDAWPSAGTSETQAVETLKELGVRVVPLTGQREPLKEHGLVVLEHNA
jgi:FkbM family methyltransferase